ncbi:MAG TPA: bifunctional phosphopantothenoylcysteine decarboxylase/phosphopantothenate--cysteine ligase CoaBC [Gemmatimonadales bacterium]|jgi:phosphopantothenoylcysteine decarboxylase/phosphopantothenate--cysteine ligase|nr:bifunctional phosphopantothenoylcysteine decarboxylase/phosphopantothenate--cysteine ligase CoaBC [Gemmatimonadales bacterium]
MPFAGRHVVLGVSGGIACYKSCALARRLTEAGATVDVVLTASAAEFVRPVTFAALTGRPVLTSLWDRDRSLAHIALAKEPELVIVAPATAHLVARAAMGMADDLLTTLLLVRTGPVLVAPAMNDAMYAHPATTANLRILAKRGWQFVGPEVGALAEGPSERPGRMSEPETILAAAARVIGREGGKWAGKRVVVTAGPTREHLDPVRVLTNPSSGRMGYALAEAAYARGADVVLVTGPTELAPPGGVVTHRVETTEQMQRAVQALMKGAAALFMAAAPADYRPKTAAASKRARQDGALSLELEATPDILRSLKRPAGCVVIGFALETGNGLARAREKLQDKALDFVVLNDALEPGAGFEVMTNRVTVIGKSGRQVELPLLPKRDVAERILDVVQEAL